MAGRKHEGVKKTEAPEVAALMHAVMTEYGVTFRQMEQVGMLSHNSFVAAADGHLPRWESVERHFKVVFAVIAWHKATTEAKKAGAKFFLDKAKVPADLLQEAKQRWQQACDRKEARKLAVKAANGSAATVRLEATTATKPTRPTSTASMQERQAGTPVTATTTVVRPRVTPASLEMAGTRQDLVGTINDMLQLARRDPSLAWRFGDPDTDDFLATDEAHLVITGSANLLTLEMITKFVDACHGTQADHCAWRRYAQPILEREPVTHPGDLPVQRRPRRLTPSDSVDIKKLLEMDGHRDPAPVSTEEVEERGPLRRISRVVHDAWRRWSRRG